MTENPIQFSKISIVDTTANPAPLGLLGFGMTTILLNLHNTGLYGLNAMIIGMGLFIGGLAQVIAGIEEWKKNNTFGATAFTSYGFFWISLCAILLLPRISVFADMKADETSMGCYLMLWGVFTLGMFIGTLKLNRALQIVFGTLVLLFFLLAIADFTGVGMIKIIAGYIGLVCGFTAVYASLAQVLNEVYKKTIFPLG